MGKHAPDGTRALPSGICRCLGPGQQDNGHLDKMTPRIRIIGAGLAGCEAAWQCARRGVKVILYEMRPVRSTPAHQTGDFDELVCSHSLKSDSENTAPWLLKEEMRRADSLLMQIARECSVPAGGGFAGRPREFSARGAGVDFVCTS